MIAIFTHELKSYFHTLTAYVFGAFLLMFIGIGALIYNINAAVSNFEYVLAFCDIVFAIIVPLLTMRTIAEERKQKTDQLLYSLPITTTQVILGKFLALAVIFLIPVCIIAVYPLIFARFGDVYLPTAYGTLVAFYLMGCALIALGVFISSLTENQGLAAGIGVAVILFNYYSVSFSEYVSATAYTSLVALCVLSCIIAVIVYVLTKNDTMAGIIGIVLAGGFFVIYFVDSSRMEGLLPAIMTKLSFFKQFNTIVNGVFDLTGICFFVSMTVLFLFLSVQSLEKRRYN